jgi:hypothetical protein
MVLHSDAVMFLFLSLCMSVWSVTEGYEPTIPEMYNKYVAMN